MKSNRPTRLSKAMSRSLLIPAILLSSCLVIKQPILAQTPEPSSSPVVVHQSQEDYIKAQVDRNFSEWILKIIPVVTGIGGGIGGLVTALILFQAQEKIKPIVDTTRKELGSEISKLRGDFSDLQTNFGKQETLMTQLNTQFTTDVDYLKGHMQQLYQSLQLFLYREAEKRTTVEAINRNVPKPSPCVKPLTPEMEETIQSGKVSSETQDKLQELVNKLDELKNLQPDLTFSAKDYVIQGNAFFVGKNFAKALAFYQEATDLEPTNARAWCAVGNAQFSLEHWAEALDSYKKAIYYKPDYAEAWYGKGNTYVRQASPNHEEALSSYDQATNLKPDYAEAWYAKSLVFSYLGRHEEALQSLDKASALQPDYYWIWYDRAKALSNLNRYQEAIDSYDKAIALKPDYTAAVYGKISALLRLAYPYGHIVDHEKFDEAIRIFNREALSLKHELADDWCGKGAVQLTLHDYPGAYESYDRASQAMGACAEAWCGKGYVLLERPNDPQPQEALNCFLGAILWNPNFAEAWKGKGDALGRLGRYVEAVESYDQALKIKPQYVDALYGLGLAQIALKRYKPARNNLDEAVKLNPSLFWVWCDRGGLLKCLKDYDEAVRSYKKATEVAHGQYPQAWYGMAECYALKSETSHAIDCLNHALGLPNLKDSLAKDSDFDAIRTDERFQDLIEA